MIKDVYIPVSHKHGRRRGNVMMAAIINRLTDGDYGQVRNKYGIYITAITIKKYVDNGNNIPKWVERNCLNLYLQMLGLYVFLLCSCFTLFCIGDISTDILIWIFTFVKKDIHHNHSLTWLSVYDNTLTKVCYCTNGFCTTGTPLWVIFS